MREIKAPHLLPIKDFKIFLAGSIDMGSARDWQNDVVNELKNYDVALINPRRNDWDSSWKQEIENDQFREQVTWEQRGLSIADYRVFVFTAESKAPITFLELGEFINHPGCICVEPGFYRKANIEITAKLHNMPVFTNLQDMVTHVITILDGKGLRR